MEKNHKIERELLVGFYKVGSGKPSMTWSQSVDEALCFGWIDGIRRSIDKNSYSIRFTPRKTDSIWSTVNMQKMKDLIRQGLMKPEGLASFEKRKESKSGIYSYEKEPVKLSTPYQRKFKANKKAWTFFESSTPYYKKLVVHWVMAAKQEKTRVNRLEKLIKESGAGRRLY